MREGNMISIFLKLVTFLKNDAILFLVSERSKSETSCHFRVCWLIRKSMLTAKVWIETFMK